MTTIGDVAVKLGLDSKEFIKEIDKAEDECKKLEHNLNETKESFEKMSKAMAMTKNPSKEMVKTFNQLKSSLIQEQKAFGNFENKLKGFEGGLIKGKEGVNLLSGALGKLVAGGTIIALGRQMISFAKQSTEAYRTQDRAVKSLNTALQNAGVYAAEYSNHLQELSSEIQSFSNYGDEVIQKAIGLGQAYSGNVQLTDDLIKATVDFAAATETDLQTAFTLVGKSIGTNTNALARYGVSLDNNMTKEQKATEIQRVLSERFKGSAKDMSDASVQLTNAIDDLSEEIGGILNPVIEEAQKLLKGLANDLTDVFKNIRVATKDINKLTLAEAELRLEQAKSGAKFAQNWKVNKDYIKSIEDRIAVLKREEAIRAENSKNNKPTGTGAGTGTSATQDKALEAYKKYIEEYAKLNDDYAATLQARQYVEGTLNIDPVTQAEEYDKMITLYQAHLSKMAEIRRSGAKNQAEIEKLENEKLAQDLQELRLSKEQETQRKLQEVIKGYNDTAADIDTTGKYSGFGVGFLGGLSSQYKAKLDLEKWYQGERKKIIKDTNYTIEEQQKAFASLDNLRNAKQIENNLKTWEEYGNQVSGILSNSFTSILSGQENFGDAMKSLLGNLYSEMIKMLFNEVMKEIELEQMLAAARMALRALTGGIGNFFSGLFSGGTPTGVTPSILPSHHSGGMIPGTKEQVAVLQGGERVLNRSEAASYNSDDASGDSGINNIMVFNIKAWDGRDVIDTLKANEQTINQIVSSGIKNNKQGLRTIVQNT